MPVIPTLKENQRLSQGGVSPFQNTKDARAAGENLQLLGRSIASVADSLAVAHKEDTFTRSQLVKQAETYAEMQAKTFLSANQKVNTKDDGSKLVDNYNKYMADQKVKFQESIPEAFRAYTATAYDTSSMKNTGEILKEKIVKNNAFQLGAFQENTSGIINEVKVSPDLYEKNRLKSLAAIQEATDKGILSKETFFDNVKNNEKKLAESQIDGYVGQVQTKVDFEGKNGFMKAKEALIAHKDKFTPEEYAKKEKSIEDARWTSSERIMHIEDRAEKKMKEINEAKQKKALDDIFIKIIENPGDEDLYKKQYLDGMKAGKYKYTMPEAFKALKLAEERQDAAMSYEISTLLGKSPTNAHIEDLKDRVKFYVSDNYMEPKTGQYWLLKLDAIKEGMKKDPNYNMQVQSIHALIKRATGVGPLEAMTDFNGENLKQANMLWLKASTWLGKGLPPNTVKQYLLKDMGISKDLSGSPVEFPVSGITNNVLDSMEKIKEERDSVINLRYGPGGSGMSEKKFREHMKFLKRQEDSLKAKSALVEKGVEHLTDPLVIPSGNANIPYSPEPAPIPFRR